MLPGGSPGPDAEGSWTTLLLILLLGVAATTLMLWYFFHVCRKLGT